MENRIALYSPHTSFDSILGGVNDWLAAAFDLKKSCPIKPNNPNPENGVGRLCTLKNKITIDQAVELIKKHVGIEHVRLARARNSGNKIFNNKCNNFS